ncbi:MAG: hypothetical protein KA717_08520 [Woronichinia naegeliana WA131]|uniref:Uncharacterized protein n=1 Tax=Woronichinia naegeliana WA131 TaxID=2824559 RepID=A0A977KZI9_9CYAN|nr:MAG: hypothetical protein KA717_08520 [Woronichinia naegeliana WA131]
MSTLNKSSIDLLSDIGLPQEKEEALFQKNCPHCYSEKVKIHSHYQTKGNGERKMFICQECSSCFAETYGSVIAGLETPLSEIVKVLKARMEGIGLNAAARVFGYAKTTILNWEKKLSGLQETLFLYALVNEFVKLVIEGDELYTKVGKNKEASGVHPG